MPDPHHGTEQMETAVKLYLGVLRGFMEAKVSEIFIFGKILNGALLP